MPIGHVSEHPALRYRAPSHRALGPGGRSVSTAAVLLVDDVPGEAVNFSRVFADHLSAARTLTELEEQLDSGRTWDLAFVDFNLSDPSVTGLSAMLRLRQLRPETTIVTYSQLGENGRVLFAAAARHWLGARAVLDKSQNHPQTLARYATALAGGLDPSPVQWRKRLQRAHLIDALLPDASWIERWRALDQTAGDVTAAAAMLNLKPAHLRGFKERAVSAVNQVNEALFDLPNPGPSRNKKGILGKFIAQHTSFLTAPDLPAVLAYRDVRTAVR
jgi:CheY-like chemotaxis protein